MYFILNSSGHWGFPRVCGHFGHFLSSTSRNLNFLEPRTPFLERSTTTPLGDSLSPFSDPSYVAVPPLPLPLSTLPLLPSTLHHEGSPAHYPSTRKPWSLKIFYIFYKILLIWINLTLFSQRIRLQRDLKFFVNNDIKKPFPRETSLWRKSHIFMFNPV